MSYLPIHSSFPLPAQPIAFGAANRPVSPVFQPVVDRVTFSSQGSSVARPTPKQAYENAKKEALALFKGHSKTEQLLNAMQTHFENSPWWNGEKHGLQLINGDIGQAICEQDGAQAFLQAPHTLLYGQASSHKGVTLETYRTALQTLEEKKALGVFMRKQNFGLGRTIAIHELFHALQHKNGCVMATDLATDSAAAKFLAVPNWKRILYWPVEIPYALVKGLFTGAFWKKQDKPTIGQAVRINMAREMEVDRFIIFNGGKVGVSLLSRLAHLGHFLGESLPQWLRSWRVEHPVKAAA